MSTQTKGNGSDVAIAKRRDTDILSRTGLDVWPDFAQTRRLMRYLFGGFVPFDWSTSLGPIQVPHIDMYEKDGKTIIECPLAGFRKENIQLRVDDNRLTISATQTDQKDRENANYVYRELRRGHFERAIQLPASIDPSKIDARYDGGMLKITIPTAHAQSGKTIEIKG